MAWTTVTAASWSLGWLATWAVVGLDADRGFHIFGASGALLVTVLTGLALRSILAAPRDDASTVRLAVAVSA